MHSTFSYFYSLLFEQKISFAQEFFETLLHHLVIINIILAL